MVFNISEIAVLNNTAVLFVFISYPVLPGSKDIT